MIYSAYMSGHSQTIASPTMCGAHLYVRDLAYTSATKYNFCINWD